MKNKVRRFLVHEAGILFIILGTALITISLAVWVDHLSEGAAAYSLERVETQLRLISDRLQTFGVLVIVFLAYPIYVVTRLIVWVLRSLRNE